ncbi:MAG: hypothetical protein U0871_09010 [Gemmataceae bacterium]
MDPRTKTWLFLGGLVLAGVGFVLALKWMERRGWVRLSGSVGGVAGGMKAVREVVEPPARFIERVAEDKPRPSAPGDPPD